MYDVVDDVLVMFIYCLDDCIRCLHDSMHYNEQRHKIVLMLAFWGVALKRMVASYAYGKVKQARRRHANDEVGVGAVDYGGHVYD